MAQPVQLGNGKEPVATEDVPESPALKRFKSKLLHKVAHSIVYAPVQPYFIFTKCFSFAAMNKNLLLLILLSFLFAELNAQSRGKMQEEKFSDNLWVGMHIGNLSFGTNVYGHGSFNINLTPIVGYDIARDEDEGNFFSSLSVGAMLKFGYYYDKLNISPELDKIQSVDWGPTVFTRLLVFDRVFAQLEYEKGYFNRPFLNSSGQIVDDKIQQDYMYIGLGYSSGDEWRYEISLYYNLLDEFDSLRIPFDYRIAITYHF